MSLKTKRLREAVVLRAGGHCESCGVWCGTDGHLDHQFGRARLPESLANCWYLCPHCDDNKTHNRPNSASWLRRFIVHAESYGYSEEISRAQTRLLWLADSGRAA